MSNLEVVSPITVKLNDGDWNFTKGTVNCHDINQLLSFELKRIGFNNNYSIVISYPNGTKSHYSYSVTYTREKDIKRESYRAPNSVEILVDTKTSDGSLVFVRAIKTEDPFFEYTAEYSITIKAVGDPEKLKYFNEAFQSGKNPIANPMISKIVEVSEGYMNKRDGTVPVVILNNDGIEEACRLRVAKFYVKDSGKDFRGDIDVEITFEDGETVKYRKHRMSNGVMEDVYYDGGFGKMNVLTDWEGKLVMVSNIRPHSKGNEDKYIVFTYGGLFAGLEHKQYNGENIGHLLDGLETAGSQKEIDRLTSLIKLNINPIEPRILAAVEAYQILQEARQDEQQQSSQR